MNAMAELRVVMRFPPRSSIPLFFLGLALTCANAEFSDPVGYMTFKLVGGMKGSMAVPLAQGYRWIGPVAAAGPDYVESASNLPNDLLGAGNSACLDVRSGPGAGQSLRVTSVSGRRVYFEGPALTELATGVMVGVRPNWTLGEMLGSPPFGDIQQGPTHVEADVIGLQDPATQTIREFFYKTEEGWREIGDAEEGDRSTVAVPFRSSLQFHRKASSDLNVVMFGAVPMFGAAHHWVRVWPGRNLITTPFSPARKIKDFIDVSSLNSGLSAARSDTFRLVYEDASLSKIIFHHDERGWTTVAREEEYDVEGQLLLVEDTRVEIAQTMDLQRNGEGGYLKFTAFAESSARSRTLAVAEEVLPVESQLSDFVGKKIGWRSQPGGTYQVQTRAPGGTVWSDLGDPVRATGEICQKVCNPDGSGIFRVVVR
jgi:hypothetical protein